MRSRGGDDEAVLYSPYQYAPKHLLFSNEVWAGVRQVRSEAARRGALRAQGRLGRHLPRRQPLTREARQGCHGRGRL
eukprot:1403669-Alexandrium_andersonii.AAC.1